LCEISADEIKDAKITRLGFFNKDKPRRQILIPLKPQETKRKVFRNANKLPKYVPGKEKY
jgi:hypothetical protein